MVINDLDIDRAGRALKLYASRKAQFGRLRVQPLYQDAVAYAFTAEELRIAR